MVTARRVRSNDLRAAWRSLAFGFLAACVGFADAQSVRSVGTGSAEIALEATLELGATLMLRLTTDELVFDLNALGSDDAPVCVVGDGPDRITGMGLDGGDAVFPAGTSLAVTTWPTIEVLGGSPLAAYPPPPRTVGGVVCYRTFGLEVFANQPGSRLAVSRTDRPESVPFPPSYVASVCPDDDAGALLPLEDGDRRTLLHDAGGGECRDMLVALAVRIDAVGVGTAITDLQYTLLAADADFGAQ